MSFIGDPSTMSINRANLLNEEILKKENPFEAEVFSKDGYIFDHKLDKFYQQEYNDYLSF